MQVVETTTFARWLKRLRDQTGRRAIVKRIARIVSTGNLGDHASVGDGVSELRIHIGPGYRLYYTMRGGRMIVILCGGAKGSQERDMDKAKELAAELD